MIRETHDTLIDKWILKNHYLNWLPAGAKLRLEFMEGDFNKGYRRVGGMLWGRPCARMLNKDLILELTRMYFIDNTGKNTESRALARARAYIRKRFPQIKLLVAYSDLEEGHVGTVYLADNWCPFGIVEPMKWTRNDRPRNDKPSRKQRWVRSP